VHNPSQRKELLDKTVTEGWTCEDLAYAIKNLDDRPVKDQRGRPFRTPTDLDGAITQQLQSAEKWDCQYSRIWNKPDCSLATLAGKLQPNDVTDEHLRRAKELAGQLWQVARLAEDQAEKAEQVVKDLERVLNERQLSGMKLTASTKSGTTG
jgi:hypothetical protein